MATAAGKLWTLSGAGPRKTPSSTGASNRGGAVITGAEPLSGWTKVHAGVWKARVQNAVFTDRNPYTTLVSGDWFDAGHVAHLGDVYLNGKSLYEVTDKSEVYSPKPSAVSWDPDFSVYVR